MWSRDIDNDLTNIYLMREIMKAMCTIVLNSLLHSLSVFPQFLKQAMMSDC